MDGNQVCPANWKPGAETLKPSLDLDRAKYRVLVLEKEHFGAEFLLAKAAGFDLDADVKTVRTDRGGLPLLRCTSGNRCAYICQNDCKKRSAMMVTYILGEVFYYLHKSYCTPIGGVLEYKYRLGVAIRLKEENL